MDLTRLGRQRVLVLWQLLGSEIMRYILMQAMTSVLYDGLLTYPPDQ